VQCPLPPLGVLNYIGLSVPHRWGCFFATRQNKTQATVHREGRVTLRFCYYHPVGPGTILRCDYNRGGFQPPEMERRGKSWSIPVNSIGSVSSSTTAISSRRSTLSTIGSSPLTGTRTRRMQKEQFNRPGYRQVLAHPTASFCSSAAGPGARKPAPGRRAKPPERRNVTPTGPMPTCGRSAWKPSADRLSRRRPSASLSTAASAGLRSSAIAARRGRACR
jgi:hypothetical protein